MRGSCMPRAGTRLACWKVLARSVAAPPAPSREFCRSNGEKQVERVVHDDLRPLDSRFKSALVAAKPLRAEQPTRRQLENVGVHRAHDALTLEPAFREARAGVVAG